MDLDRHGRPSPSRHFLRSANSSGSLQPSTRTSNIASQPHSRHLSSHQGFSGLNEYRTPEFMDGHRGSPLALANAINPHFSWRLRPQASEDAPFRPPSHAKLRRRRIQQDFQGEVNIAGTTQQRIDVSLLYPQMSPYANPSGSRSAPDAMQHFPKSVSQPNSPDFLRHRRPHDEAHEMRMPNISGYSPSAPRRIHSASRVHDVAFTSEHDYHLFAEATAGLGLGYEEAAMPHAQPPASAEHLRRSSHTDSSVTRFETIPAELVSPLEDSPSTARALQGLAQMPQRWSEMPRRRMQTSASGLDLWLSPPSATSGTVPTPVSPMASATWAQQDAVRSLRGPVDDLDHSNAEDQSDGELPDYASSQAQAQSAQREAATRRAQELQRRWRQADSTRGT